MKGPKLDPKGINWGRTAEVTPAERALVTVAIRRHADGDQAIEAELMQALGWDE